MTMIFIFALIKKDNSIVDIFWGLGFMVIAGYSLIQSGDLDLRKIIVNFLIVLWGLRLSFYIYQRNAGKDEDFRYKAWRKSWSLFYLRSYFQIFMLQGLIMLVVASPIWFINFTSSGPLGLWDFLGLVTFGAGFLIEVLSDSELAEFKKNPANKGKLLTNGLWSKSRHPNYFGEALLWWGISFYALSMSGGWMTLVGPVVITLLLRFVSGVPMLEEKFKSHPDWDSYKAKTAPFVPFLHRF
jgi:steroid 5-alpha reductase family enzyme